MLHSYNSKYNQEEYYDEGEVAETLWEEVCKDICDERQRDAYNMLDLFACEKCQRKVLHPSVIGVAIQSVRENDDPEND